jgi:hypothetical protein
VTLASYLVLYFGPDVFQYVWKVPGQELFQSAQHQLVPA